MVGWHHRLDGHEFEQAPGVGDGQGGLASCSPWGRKESDTTEQLNANREVKYSCTSYMSPGGGHTYDPRRLQRHGFIGLNVMNFWPTSQRLNLVSWKAGKLRSLAGSLAGMVWN